VCLYVKAKVSSFGKKGEDEEARTGGEGQSVMEKGEAKTYLCLAGAGVQRKRWILGIVSLFQRKYRH
jgi:hypothetical protein